MSGRQYDRSEFYMCTKCTSRTQTRNSMERNFNGPMCLKCGKSENLVENEKWNNYEYSEDEKKQIDDILFRGEPLNFFNRLPFMLLDRDYCMKVIDAKRQILKTKKLY